jgi:hypothetical protein
MYTRLWVSYPFYPLWSDCALWVRRIWALLDFHF